MRHIAIITFACALLSLPLMAQNTVGLRSSVEAEKQISKGFNATLEAQYRQTEIFKNTDRWSIGLKLSKRIYRNFTKTFNIKANLSYKYINDHNSWSTKYKGNDINIPNGMEPQYYIDGKHDFNLNAPYNKNKHRIMLSAQASYKYRHFKLSLREGYQFTHHQEAEFTKDKYRFNNNEPIPVIKTDIADTKMASDKQMIRSKITLNYNRPDFMVAPFVSYEFYNSIDNSFKLHKTKLTTGLNFCFNKQHDCTVSYLWQNEQNSEPTSSFLCIGYKYSF